MTKKLSPGVTKAKPPRFPHQRDTSKAFARLLKSGNFNSNITRGAIARILAGGLDHNDLALIQGGGVNDNFHFTAAKHAQLILDLAAIIVTRDNAADVAPLELGAKAIGSSIDYMREDAIISDILPATTTMLDGAAAITQAADNNTTKVATTAFVLGQTEDAINDAEAIKAPSQNAVFDALALKAPLASPVLTGNPEAPTQSVGDNSTKIATTAYVLNELANLDVVRIVGAIDCSANPNYPAADAGDIHYVSVAGKIGGASGPVVEVEDTALCITDSSASGDHATVGANWVLGQANLQPELYLLIANIVNDLVSSDTDKALSAAQGKALKDVQDNLPIANLDIDGGADIGAELTDADLVIIDDGAGGTNRKSALSRVKTYVLDERSRGMLEDESGIITYGNGAIYRFDDWEQTGILTGSNAWPVPYKNSLSNVFTGFEVGGYKGNGTSQKFIYNIGPGLNWFKSRDNAFAHRIFDINRNLFYWGSQATSAHSIFLNNAGSTKGGEYDINYNLSILDDGKINTLNDSVISWNWSYPLAKAWHPNGESTRKVPTPWGIVDSVEANANANIAAGGIIIELYNPLTGNGCLLYVGTGANRLLDISGGIVPEFMFVKQLSDIGAGIVYHAQANGGTDPGDYFFSINATDAETNSAATWNDTEPTVSLAALGTGVGVNEAAQLHILYYFSPVVGLQKFGGYAGNAGANNQATGCKDGMFFIKLRAGGTGNFECFDSFRGNDVMLLWNATTAEQAQANVGFNATEGIDITSSAGDINASGDDYVYGHFGKEMVIQGDIDVYPTTSITSSTPNDNVEIYVKYKGAGALNTEVVFYASRKTTPDDWVTLVTVKVADMNDDWQLLRVTGDISGTAAGTDMRWRIVTDESGSETEHNFKDLDISWS